MRLKKLVSCWEILLSTGRTVSRVGSLREDMGEALVSGF